MNGFAYHPQRGIVMSLEGHYRATVHLPEARFETDWADSCVWLPQTGIEVLVVFINGDQNRPVIVGRFPTENEEGTPLIELAGGGAPIARVGDMVQVTGVDSNGDTFTATGTITTGSTKVTSG
ncbi:hypothetical protein DNHGIG_15150 [Collibacillus ludicampi]|uniref:Gp5/Type VI secretion system Vgr protein OB-fold domain-containing protein n=1 Tax=Collibacillus ludicampi TaxID=2771369 RepID=A0AAV4LDU0_9BACL|nr:hypothetical protein [Collibacillus ludicampi]GIM45966.1 hypothetical protein DNHGIG_15150 [Collibacillus ludicampi]